MPVLIVAAVAIVAIPCIAVLRSGFWLPLAAAFLATTTRLQGGRLTAMYQVPMEWCWESMAARIRHSVGAPDFEAQQHGRG